MDAGNGEGHYDLEDRTYAFAERVRRFLKTVPRTIANIEDGRQLVRASGSVGANYIEANESLGKKDFRMHIRICRKESKESRFFLRLMDVGDSDSAAAERAALVKEAAEFVRIFSAILRSSE